MTSDPHDVIEIVDIRKSYGATKALAGASFSVRSGSVHALLGENGAGKSTMIKLLSGMTRQDSGEILVEGRPVVMHEPRDAYRNGLQTAFQELTLLPDLTVVQNMVLPNAPTGFGWQLRHRAARRAVAEHFDRLGLGGIDIHKEVRSLDLNTRQKVEIARAVFRKPRVLFLDEATSAMSGADVEWLSGLVAALKHDGVTTVLITHRMAEVRQFCDAVTVLRNGRDVGSFMTDEVDDRSLVEMIVGRSLAAVYPAKPACPPVDRPVLSVSGLATSERLIDCSFDLRRGEVLGVAALQGMGQRELFLALFGALPLRAGVLSLDGERIVLGSPSHAISLGFGLVPEDRKTEGLFLKLDGRENVLMPMLHRFSRLGLIDSTLAESSAAGAMSRVEVDLRALQTPSGAFSGGNQQKLVLAKWLVAKTRVLLLFDPTRGVDVGTKREIYLLIRAYAEAGGAVLMYSTEIPELVNLCDRVLVMYGGRAVHAFGDGFIEEHAIMAAALGQEESGRTPARAVVAGLVS